MDKEVCLLTIEKEKRDRSMGGDKKIKGNGRWGREQFVWFGKKIPRKLYLTFGSEQESSIVLFWSEELRILKKNMKRGSGNGKSLNMSYVSLWRNLLGGEKGGMHEPVVS